MTKKFKSPSKNKGDRIQPRESGTKSATTEYPNFSLRFIDRMYCLSRCEKDEKAAFADALLKLSRLKWNEIINAPRHGLGCEKISKDALTRPVPNHISNDVNFIAFRFSGLKAMIGYRDMNTFYIIWIDRDFSLYQHR